MDSTLPLAGVRVLDASRLLPGPFASMILCDLGADVDKLEDTGGGDYLRVTPPFVDDGMGAMYHICNRGKRSIALDLKTEEGRALFLELLPKYDVLLESNRPGVMERLGLGYETLKKVHPGLVMCAITGYGQTGPLRDRAGHDLNYIARAGVLGATGPTDGAPQMPGVQIADITGGLYGVIGVLAALHGRKATGEGRYVDISMAEAALSVAVIPLGVREGGWSPPRGSEVLTGGIAPYNTYATKDGGAMTLGALEPKFWQAFCVATGLPVEMKALMLGPHQVEWKAKLTALFAEKTTAEWAEFAKGVDCCLEPVVPPDAIPDDPLHVERKVFETRATHGGQSIRMMRTPVATPRAGIAPKQGADTDAILREAGLDEAQIAKLRAAGVVKG